MPRQNPGRAPAEGASFRRRRETALFHVEHSAPRVAVFQRLPAFQTRETRHFPAVSVLHLHAVTKRYPRNPAPAVDDLTLEIRDAEILSVVGESGSGKTTLLRLIAGLEIPDSGSISIGGKLVNGPGVSPVPPERRGVGMVFQNYALFPHLTIRDNILYGLYRAPRREREETLRHVLELTGLTGLEKRWPHEVSGGQQQRIALARALAPKPGIVLLDEPFSNLDVSLRQQLRDDVSRILRAAGATGLLVTHDTRDALAVSDRIAVMKNGRLQQLGNPREIYSSPANEATALLFGRMNFLPPGFLSRDSALQARPEDLELYPPPSPPGAAAPEGSAAVTVVRSHFYGDRQEVIVAASANASLELVVYADPSTTFHPGQNLLVRRRAAS